MMYADGFGLSADPWLSPSRHRADLELNVFYRIISQDGVNLFDDVFFQKLKLVQPGRTVDMHQENFIFECSRLGVCSNDLSDSSFPEMKNPSDSCGRFWFFTAENSIDNTADRNRRFNILSFIIHGLLSLYPGRANAIDQGCQPPPYLVKQIYSAHPRFETKH